MWRIIFEGARLTAERVAALLDGAMVPEAQAVSLFETADAGCWRLEAIYEDETEAKAALDLLDDQQRLQAAASPVPQEDWVAKSLAGLPPVRAGRFVIHGEHHANAAQAGDIALQIEAGMAFGTGHHGTTQGCLEALDRLSRTRRFSKGLDVGCGTGILALAVARRFHIPVVASDLDADATAMTRENARINGCAPFITVLTAPGTRHPDILTRGPYDLVMANILMGPLLRLAGNLVSATAPGGLLVLSGLLVDQENRVLAAYRGRGMRVRDRLHREGWSTLALEKPLKTA
ncbi:MAG: 50S ribosomal protein L11 methyltransferase [Alphaproteobacteria bacterium]